MTRQTIKRPIASVGVKLIEQVKFPGPGAWDDLVRHLKLRAAQTSKLQTTVHLVVEDIESYRSVMTQRPTRRELVSRLKLMEKALSNLQHEMDRSLHLMGDFLPHASMEHIGRSMTFSAIGESIGKNVFSGNIAVFIERTLAEGQQITMAALDEFSRPRREALGLKHGHLMLKHFIDAIHAPLQKWVALDRLNKGGRPPQAARAYLIYRLAEAAPGIIGKSATIASTGPFVTLCSLVLPACGLSAKGVAKAIPPIVRQVRADQAKHRSDP